MPGKLRTAVIGATGYAGFELTRLLLRHPGLHPPLLFKRPHDHAGPESLAEIFPAIAGNGGYPLCPLSWATLESEGVDLVFLATPHESSRNLAPEALARGMRVIDLSGAWRL